MQRKRWAVGAGAALLAGAALAAGTGEPSSGVSQAEGGKTSSKQKATTSKASELRTVTVIVKQVDPEHHKVTFEATVKREATTSSGQPIKLDQLREGDKIRASFDPKTGEVVRVDLTPAQGHSGKTH
jgi:Cu/Ag efflux protein CusF